VSCGHDPCAAAFMSRPARVCPEAAEFERVET
jgi:hypothetical protein